MRGERREQEKVDMDKGRRIQEKERVKSETGGCKDTKKKKS